MLRPRRSALSGLGLSRYTKAREGGSGAHLCAWLGGLPQNAAAAYRFPIEFWSLVMAQVCEVCGKGPQFGNNISHAHNISRRRWNVNLRPVKAKIGGGNKRIRVCTSCIKAGKVTKA
jgi:large subunit ribosomal protein L28